jgi:hypothetical protein
MSNYNVPTFEHVLDLHPGKEGVINFRFPKNNRADLTVGLASVDPAKGTAELVLDNLWRGYEMVQFVKSEDRWTSLRPGPDGNVHAVIGLGAPKNLNISSDDALYHSVQLTDATWKGDALRLTFRESGPVTRT